VKRAVPFIALAAMSLATACGDTSPTSPRLAPGQPSSLLSDGSKSGNADFFFLPPIAANPQGHSNYSAGKFNPNLRPVVRVCRLDTDDMGALATAACVAGPPAAQISASEISTTEEFYKVVWTPRDASIDRDGVYRLQVFVGTTSLGFADLTVINTKGEVKSAILNEVFPMSENRSIPIKFRIESGAAGACQRSPNDCTEVSVSPAGGTFFTNTHFAAVTLQPDFASAEAFAAGGGTILLTIERVQVDEGESCHSAASGASRLLEEQSGCYHYETDPDLDEDPDGEGPRMSFGGFQTAGNSVAQCSGLARNSENSNQDWILFKSDPGRPLQALRDVPEPGGLNCADFAFLESLPSNPVLRFASLKLHSVKRAVNRAIGVKVAYAWDRGLGGLLLEGDGFSNISRGRGALLEKTAGDEQSAPAGTRAPFNPTVRITSVHPHHHEGEGDDVGGGEDHHHPLANVAVTFRAIGGNFGDGTYGSVPEPKTEVIKYTDENGEASVPWYLGAGANTVTAEASSLDPSTVTFTATGLEAVGSISGLVSDADGSALDNAPVRLVGITNPDFKRSTTTDDGEYSFASLPDGRYSVAAGAIGFTMVRQEIVLGGEGRDQTVNFTLTPTGGIAGGVTNAVTGAAISGASVGIVGTQTGVVTNADGRFVFANLRAGSYQLRATMVNFVPRTVDVTVGADQAPVTIALQPAPADLAVTSFTFSPAQPTTADRVTYNIVVTNLGGTMSEAGLATLTESGDGELGQLNPNLVLPAIGPGLTVGYTLLAADLGASSRSTTFTVNTGTPPVPDANAGNNAATVTFTVTPAPTGTVVGQVTDAATGLPLGSAAISVVGGTGQVFTNVAGNYSLQAPQGPRTLRASRLGYASADATVTVTDGQVTVNFALQPAPGLPGGGTGCTVNCTTTPP
jgi:hypothetical protein